MRILRVLAVVLPTVVLLVICALAACAGWQIHRAHRLQAEVERQVSARLAQAVPAERGERNRLVDAARAEPDREQLEQHCEFSTVDAGWTVQSNQQFCTLESSLVWSAPDRAQADALAARIATGSGEQLEVGVTDRPGCTLQQSADLVVAVTNRQCDYPSRLGMRPVGPARGHRVRGLRVEVWHTTSLGWYDLGCRPASLFCDNPLGRPTFGTPPATPAPR